MTKLTLTDLISLHPGNNIQRRFINKVFSVIL